MGEKWEPKERKSFPFELEDKAFDVEEGVFAGYAAVCGNLDDGGDIIESGAFKKTLAERGPASGRNRVKVFRFHDFHQPIGKTLDVREVSRGKMPKDLLERFPGITGGLYVRGQISHTPAGDEVLTLMRDGVVDEMSIGYDSMKDELEEQEGGAVRRIKELKLYCCDPVPLAMNAAALITDVKEFKPEETEDWIHIPVRDAGDFVDGSFRTITISADEGIKAVIGKLTSDPQGSTKVQKYLFSKEKGWTMAKARAWVKEHQKGEIDFIETAETQEAEEVKRAEAARKALIGGLIQKAYMQRQQTEEL